MKKLQLFAVFALTLFIGMSVSSCKKVTDADLLTSVQTVLATLPEASDVSATVTEKVLTLSGTVETEEAKAAVEKAVGAVDGLQSVVNNLNVLPPAPDFAAIDQAIQSGLAEILKDQKSITAAVEKGVVFLKGEIKQADLPAIVEKLSALNPESVNTDSLVVK